jgi:hypothetical protein
MQMHDTFVMQDCFWIKPEKEQTLNDRLTIFLVFPDYFKLGTEFHVTGLHFRWMVTVIFVSSDIDMAKIYALDTINDKRLILYINSKGILYSYTPKSESVFTPITNLKQLNIINFSIWNPYLQKRTGLYTAIGWSK